MRILKLAISCSLSVVILAGTATAAKTRMPTLQQPTSAHLTSFEYDSNLYFLPQGDASESPSDRPSPPEVPEVGRKEICGDPCCKPCGSCRQPGCCCNLGEPWTLPQLCFLESRGITVGGWVSGGIYGNTRGAPQNGPLGFNTLGDGATMNQLWFYAERAANTGGYGTDWGFRFDYVFGVDGPDTQAFGDQGWDFGWNSSSHYGSAIPQLYAEFAINDLTVKFGHFYTIIGWEVVPAPDNFFYSHAYAMYYAEPLTHTGFLASYAMSDRVTAHGGWTMGGDSGFENFNDASTFLGGLSFALSDRMSLTWALTAGDFGAGRNGRVDGATLAAGDIYMNSIVLECRLSDDLTYILQHDLGENSNIAGGATSWYGINQYLQYQLNDFWAAGMRFEWFRDDDGARIIHPGYAAGNSGDYYEVTAGLNYRPHANVVVRPEMRYDWFEGSTANGHPFDGDRFDEQWSGGLDVILTF